ncbi:hypothetical protein O181_074664, partial [Austropuccinia psidii MF-1]|nr:hypothetical protein [Austropuccinia psidii MF-1]
VLNSLNQNTKVIRYNSLTLDPNSLSSQLDITAWSNDLKSKTIMGLAHKTLPFHSVQFHPESISSQSGHQIIKSFFEIISNSNHVNLGLKRSIAYSPLPDHIIKLSKIKLPSLSISNNFISSSSFKPIFQIRTLNFKNNLNLPQNVFQSSYFKSKLGKIWLDSASSFNSSSNSRYSHLANFDILLSYFLTSKTLIINHSNQSQSQSHQINSLGIWNWLKNLQENFQLFIENSNQFNSNSSNHQFNAPIGFFGYFAYESLSESLHSYNLPCRSIKSIPDTQLGFANTVLTYDHLTQTWFTSALVQINPNSLNQFTNYFGNSLGLTESNYQSWSHQIQTLLNSKPNSEIIHSNSSNQNSNSNSSILLNPIQSHHQYLQAIQNAQQFIVDGESYELCLTNQFLTQLDSKINGFQKYLRLRNANPAPFGAYVQFNDFDTQILSCSPERFININQTGQIEMKPIKGTARRNLVDPHLDAQIAIELQNNEKERAENLMITDLIRNDLHVFCVPGSIKVTKLFHLETVATVHSLVSTIVGQLKPGLNAIDAISSAFPPGSMTGAPKVRSIELLDQLEGNRPRGIYSGILGFISVDGRTDMSVVIRTVVIQGNQMSVGAGGAITSLSQKEDEWKEVELKIEILEKSL